MSDTVSSFCVQRAEGKNRISYVCEYVVRSAFVDRYLSYSEESVLQLVRSRGQFAERVLMLCGNFFANIHGIS